jgi:two-component system response regulator NreC
MSDTIRLGIYDEHRIVQEGLTMLLQQQPEFEVVLKADRRETLLEALKEVPVHVLLVNLHQCDNQTISLIAAVSGGCPRTRVLVLSATNDEETVLKIIKAGAKGFLAKETDPGSLAGAILTLRNGHDYFSHSITLLLLNKYLTRLKGDEDTPATKGLSPREIEIMRMWGNGMTNKEIADRLFLSQRTVETHKNHIMQKLNLRTSVDMIKFAIRNNIIEL